MNNRFSKILETIPPSGIRRFFDLVQNSKDIISLGVGEPDFATPWRIREEAYHSLELGKTSYTSNWGIPELRSAIADFLEKKYNCQYDPKSEVLITVGVSEAVDISLRAILNPGDEVLLPEPCFVCYSPLITLAGGKTISVDTSVNNFKLTADMLRKQITPRTKAMLICYPSNPTGTTIYKEELERIAKLSIEKDLWVITDEIYGMLTYDGVHTSIASLPGMKERTLYMNGFSKAFAMTGWRIGYVAGPADALAMIVKIHQYNTMCAPIMAQYAALEALLKCDKEAQEMKKSYQQRRNLFVEGMRKAGLESAMPEGAFYVFVKISGTGLTSEEFALQLLEKYKVAVVPGHVFGLGGEGYIRCCYATEIGLLKEAVRRIGDFVKTLK